MKSFRDSRLLRHPVARRVAGYSAGSVVAAVLGELMFAAAFGWFHVGTTWATAIGFVGGAAPNYLLNRRWAWPDRTGRSRQSEVVLYLTVIACSFAASAVATHWAEAAAVKMSPDRAWQTLTVAAAFLGVSALFFVIKFALYELVVFAPARVEETPVTEERPAVSKAS